MMPHSLGDPEKRGLVPAARAWLLGERDAITEQLRDLERQGSGIAAVAHACAFAMLILFSAGSLVGIAAESVTAFLAAWGRGHVDLIHGIAAGVSAALVICMDVASLYAALRLRVLAARRAPWRERWVHIGAIALADLLEAASIAYMTWRYDAPALGVVWALVLGRDLLAPLYAVYLSLARPLPVGARDILHLVEVGTGAGMARDAIRLANDPRAPLARKAELFVASSETIAEDLHRLHRLLAALDGEGAGDGGIGVGDTTGRHVASERQPEGRRRRSSVDAQFSYHISRMSRQHAIPHQALNVGPADDARALSGETPMTPRSNVRTPPDAGAEISGSVADEAPRRRSDTGMSQEIKSGLKAMREEVARQILELHPDIGVREFADRLQEATRWSISPSTAQGILSRLRVQSPRNAEAGGPPVA